MSNSISDSGSRPGTSDSISDSGSRPGTSDEQRTGTGSANPNMAAGEYAALVGAGVEVQLPERLRTVRDHLLDALGDDVITETRGFRGELTVVVQPDRIREVLRLCRDDPILRCELLADLCGVHWPEGKRLEGAQETTGWPTYEFGDELGRIEVDYIVYSVTHNHRFRIRVLLPDENPRLPSVTGVYASANFMEREVYDFFGVEFDGHPNLRRILMPDEWEGHPHRKDYPLGGVEVQYKGATIPPPDERLY
jgi:NADH-quinone oxidoreductase subunit C